MKTISKEELKQVLKKHKKWMRKEYDGERADLKEADLRGVKLREADLGGADLSGADLQKADLHGADLRGADTSESDLREAHMSEANLRGADMRGVDLRGADLPEKVVQVGPIGNRKDYTIYWIDRNIVQCGCWNGYQGGSLDEFIKRADEIYPPDDEKNLQYRREHLAVIELFKALKGA